MRKLLPDKVMDARRHEKCLRSMGDKNNKWSAGIISSGL
jgi:hypothetical protein